MLLNSYIEYFLHPKLRKTPDTFWKAKILIGGLLMLFTVAILLFAYALLTGNEEIYHMWMLVVCMPLILFAFKKTGALIFFGNLQIAVFAVFITPLPFYTGGIFSDDILWLIVAPVTAFATTNLRSGFFWSMYVAIIHATYFYLATINPQPLGPQIAHWTPIYYYVSISCLFLCILCLMAASKFGMKKLINQLMLKQRQLNNKTIELEEKTKELRMAEKTLLISNKELEQFAYVVSHDLKAPLRNINSFSTLLNRHLKKTYDLDDTSLEYLDFINTGTVNMTQLIEDIMTYSRAGTSKTDVEAKVEMNIIQTLINHNLHQQIQETETQINWLNIPFEVAVQKVQMLQLMQNLISNAIKYRKKEEAPVISISAKENGDNWLFQIRDNGTGISKENQKKVFDLFIKLPGTDQEGSGIGLATCKKIVQNNGGDLWLASNPGVGSTFYFTIPKVIETTKQDTDNKVVDSPNLGNPFNAPNYSN